MPAPAPSTTSPIGELFRLASTRHGVISVDDARAVGVSRSVVATQVQHGTLRPAGRGLYVATPHPRTWHQRVMVAITAHDAIASHRCAARMHKLDGFDEAPVEILARAGCKIRDPKIVLHRSRLEVPSSMITTVDGIRTTSIARTLVDLGAVVDDGKVEQALDDALRRGVNMRWITETQLECLRPGPTGWSSLARVLARPDRHGAIPDSVFERTLSTILAAAGISKIERQIRVSDEAGMLVARIDAGVVELKIGVEADSEMWHWGPRRGRAARLRHNRLTALGWSMLYLSWQDVEDPSHAIATLKLAIERAA